MGPQEGVILIDTNIFVIDLRYKRDINYTVNSAFLHDISQRRTGFTTLVNLLELCGILSFNLNEKQLLALWSYFQDRYQVTVLPAPNLESRFPTLELNEIFNLIKSKTALGDALVLAVARRYLPFISTMITWDKDHFENTFPGTVLNPEEFLKMPDPS